MALTKPRELGLYQILAVPYPTAVAHTVGVDNMLVAKIEIEQATTQQAKAWIDARLAAVAADATLQTALEALLDQWLALDINTVTLDGGVGDISGVKYDPDRARLIIAQRVKIIVPLYRCHDEIQRQSLLASGGGMEMLR
jgi:hypothetical protein